MTRNRITLSMLLVSLLILSFVSLEPAGAEQGRDPLRPEHRSFWSFQPIADPPVPQVRTGTVTPIDAFLLARLEAEGLTYRDEADRRTLLRRASYDLTGLPPTPAEMADFLADRSTGAYEKVLDRLLASPHYGEKWGRHWLDLARYSDTVGMVDAGRNLQAWFPYAYTYRDWVVRALNEDLPYDRFIEQQLAADRVPGNESRNLAALGFLSLSRGGLGVTREEKLDDKIDVVSRGLLGLTVSCARCHNHKFDPIPTQDYYSLFTVFANTREPEELPLLDTKGGGDDRHAKVLADERRRVAEEVAKLREARFPALKALYRTAPEIARLLLGVGESSELKTEAERQKFAREKDLNAFLLERWRGAIKDGPVWAIWRGLAAIPDGKFDATRAAAAISAVARSSNPRVVEAFETRPATLREAADIYGRLLAAADKPDPCTDPEEESLRQVLHGDGAPTNVEFKDYEKIMLSTDRQNEGGKRRRLETMPLEHAYEGAPPRAQSIEDLPELQPGHVLVRGNPNNRGEEVKPQFLRILSGDVRQPFTDGSGRLELARAIIDPKNPLTARVIVNRVWQYHFGAGIVRTPSDFGTRGDRPTHPELLDHLARRFIDGGWSLKSLHRQIMLTSAYRQSSSPTAVRVEGKVRDAALVDPENRLLWKMNRRRLDYEELRDSLLVAGGNLDRRPGGLPESAIAWPFGLRRTIYAFIDRALVPNDFRVFDFATPDSHSPQRYLTTVPQQALLMMNSPFVITQAQALLTRPEVVAARGSRRRVESLYRLLFGRLPLREELAAALEYIQDEMNDAPLLTTAEEERARSWSFGTGDGQGKFSAYGHFTSGAWRSSPMPGDPRTPTHFLAAQGGLASDEKGRVQIRRWTAPADARINIQSLFEQRFDNGCRKCDGLPARISTSPAGDLAVWTGKSTPTETRIEEVTVKRGQTIDFIVEMARAQEFKWRIIIRELDGARQEWDSIRDFRHPATSRLNAWERYAQVLLASAEFMMID